MKTPEKLYEDILESEELKRKLAKITGDEEIRAFLKEQGCEITSEEFGQLLREKALTTVKLGEETIEMFSDDVDFYGLIFCDGEENETT